MPTAFPTLGELDLSQFMGCPLPLQIDRCEFDAQPSVQQDAGRVGTDVRVTGEGFVPASTPAAYAAAMAALSTATSIGGVDFRVTGPGGRAIHQVLAARCLDGGPHVGFTVLGRTVGPLMCRVRFAVAARTVPATIVSAYRYRTSGGPDGLLRVDQAGQVVGPGADAYFAGNVLAGFYAAHPPALYLVSYEAEYPFTSGGAIDGEVTTRTDRDEQQRLVTTYDFDLTLSAGGSPTSVAAQLRSAIGGKITRESVGSSAVRARRLRCSFQTLRAADDGDLLNFQQSIAVTSAADAYQEFAYAGADPIAVALPKVYARVSQSGSAVGLGRFPKAPDPAFAYHEQQRPSVRYTHVNEYEAATEWSYQMLDVDGGPGGVVDVAGLLSRIGRSSVGGFYDGGGA